LLVIFGYPKALLMRFIKALSILNSKKETQELYSEDMRKLWITERFCYNFSGNGRILSTRKGDYDMLLIKLGGSIFYKVMASSIR
jgi:hypothetical protein